MDVRSANDITYYETDTMYDNTVMLEDFSYNYYCNEPSAAYATNIDKPITFNHSSFDNMHYQMNRTHSDLNNISKSLYISNNCDNDEVTRIW